MAGHFVDGQDKKTSKPIAFFLSNEPVKARLSSDFQILMKSKEEEEEFPAKEPDLNQFDSPEEEQTNEDPSSSSETNSEKKDNSE